MSSFPWPRRTVAQLAVFAACITTGPAFADAINGAIYTSKADGLTVNGNQYDAKSEVYLNGGPSNFPQCNGGKLEAGLYYFQVTNPSGSVLLSSDGIAERKFGVDSSGRISDNFGNHLDADDFPADGVERSACGSLSIQLIPYDNTPNPGGVYKVWITRVTDYEAACGIGVDCGKDGFVPGHTKTDNFRVGPEPQIPVTGSVEAIKFYDANANGLYDDGFDPLIEGWKMTLGSFNQSVNSTQFTDATGSTQWDNLIPDVDYTVEEGMPLEGNWVHSATIYDGHDGTPVNPAGPLAVVAGQTTSVAFGNYCTIPSGGRTLGFWSNRNGKAKMEDNGSLEPELLLLRGKNLRNATGAHFDPLTYEAFRIWLLDANATNMAYMLSAQMAAMVLNVEAGYVDGNAYYVPAGKTINQILAAANSSLGAYGYTPAGHTKRAYQGKLKTWLDRLNNGAGVLSPTPCAFTFE